MVTLLTGAMSKAQLHLDSFHLRSLPTTLTLVNGSGVVDEEDKGGLWERLDEMRREREEKKKKLVCVTSGNSYLGSSVVDCLLSRGYSVRIAVSNQSALDGSMAATGGRARLSVMVVDMGDVESLCAVFQDCSGVFHTSSFADPAGLSGYSKQMAEWERAAAEAVVTACGRTESVRRCVFTSSLLACIWRPPPMPSSHLLLLDESSWSDESMCNEKKLWMALGKTKAEKAAWRAAEAHDFQLSTLCPGLITGPAFSEKNSTATLAYLKGGREMIATGVLAVVDVGRAAEDHLRVYEAMERGVRGRFISFDNVVSNAAEATTPLSYRLCNQKLSSLVIS